MFLIKQGIPSFINKVDEFYEGRFEEQNRTPEEGFKQTLSSVINAISIDDSRIRFLKRVLKNKANLTILDLGCGAGWSYIKRAGRVFGIDVSFKSLVKAKTIYEGVVQADILHLPFCNDSFDLVISLDVLGHIPPGKKGQFISEIYRVTKKGGGSAHSIECDSQSLLYRWAKKFPELYNKYFIEMYGHYGLELPSRVFQRFRRSGFNPIIEKADPCKGYLRPVESYCIFFDNEYKEKSKWINILVGFCRILKEKAFIRRGVNFILGLFVPLADCLTPLNHRDSAKVYYSK